MKNFINRILSTYTKYDLVSLNRAIKYWKQDTAYSIKSKVNNTGKFIRNHLIMVSIILAILAFFSREYIIIGALEASLIIITFLYDMREKQAFKEETFYMGIEVNEVRMELDNFISECLEEYLVYSSYDGLNQISPDAETKIRNKIVDLVSARISPTLFKKLSIKYKEESVYDVIANRINIMVMNHVIAVNTNLDRERMETERNRAPKDNRYTSTIQYLNNDNQIM